ncbi:MAG: proteasome assembly chaperone family protein [Crenarchaeota archaeon]|nr:proteasome assembly chaperone family protein [Thermoproteota archaeon]
MSSELPTYREEWIGDFRFIEYRDFKLDRPSYMLIALPDAGLVSVIGATHLVKKLQMEEVGGIDSYVFPPVAIIHKGTPRPPVRMFAKGNLLVVMSEFLPATPAIPSFVSALLDYASRRGIDVVVCMTGLPIPNRFEVESLNTYFVASTKELSDKLSGLGVKLFENGYLVGPYALILKESYRRRLGAVVILTESFMEFPDPEASAKGIEVLSKVTGLKVDVGDLLEQAEIIRVKAREHMKKILPNLAQMKKEYEYTPPLYT